tara:strand:+ start:195 stop:431 length:237 start_codon:yes stop_codon:yes gene_type:complete
MSETRTEDVGNSVIKRLDIVTTIAERMQSAVGSTTGTVIAMGVEGMVEVGSTTVRRFDQNMFSKYSNTDTCCVYSFFL